MNLLSKPVAVAFAGAMVALTLTSCVSGPAAYLSINELMPRNSETVADERAEFDDWIEIYNAGDQDIDLEGYHLSDDSSNPCRAEIAAGVTLPAGGVVLFWADGAPDQGNNHLPFKLSGSGEELYLSDQSCRVIDSVTFGAMDQNMVLARHPDGEGELVLCASPTPGALNGSSCE